VAKSRQQLVVKFVAILSKVLPWVSEAWEAPNHKVPFSYFCGIYGATQNEFGNLNGRGNHILNITKG
jgi:hypothetical protein